MRKPFPKPKALIEQENEDRRVEVELPEPEACPACGTRGLHFCTGGQRGSVLYIGVRRSSR